MGKKKEERSSTFSLDFSVIGLSVFVGARDKVDPHSESHTWVPESGSFDKLQEVGVLSHSLTLRLGHLYMYVLSYKCDTRG